MMLARSDCSVRHTNVHGLMERLRLPSRYEDLDATFRAKLRPNADLNALIIKSFQEMSITGGVRFLPMFGRSGSGKTSAALELGTHLPSCHVVKLAASEIDSLDKLQQRVGWAIAGLPPGKALLVFVIDQYEEVSGEREAIPKRFVEYVSMIDRSATGKHPVLFMWLTTSVEFQRLLSEATTRNRRVLASSDFELKGPPRQDWTTIIEQTFSFHNHGRSLADFGLLRTEIEGVGRSCDTIGAAVEEIAGRLAVVRGQPIVDLSNYQVLMLWPVTDGERIAKVSQFSDARAGYVLDWNAWYRHLGDDDKRTLPLNEYNRARLYFDVRLIPIAAADLMPLCRYPERVDYVPADVYLTRLSKTHFFSILTNQWNADTYAPLRERDSERAREARTWYAEITDQSVFIGRRLANALRALGLKAQHEATVESSFSSIRADVLAEVDARPSQRIVELKVFAPRNTIPSAIRDQVRYTLKKHAQFAGYIPRQ